MSVVSSDTIDAAIDLTRATANNTWDKKHVCILNMANAEHAGGGWLKGALAQEEALCYRSCQSFKLKHRHYPIPDLGGIYSPFVVVIRKSLKDGHGLLDLRDPDKLPVVSAINVAAIRGPKVTNDDPPRYKNAVDRKIMKKKMRVILRIPAYNGHRRLILGAFGCGAFLNPKNDVADCWAEVLREAEFGSGWWESIIFAVLDDGGSLISGSDSHGIKDSLRRGRPELILTCVALGQWLDQHRLVDHLGVRCLLLGPTGDKENEYHSCGTIHFKSPFNTHDPDQLASLRSQEYVCFH